MAGIQKQLKLIRFFLSEKKFTEALEEISALELVFENNFITQLEKLILDKNSLEGIQLIDKHLLSDYPVSKQEKINTEGLQTSIKLLETELSVLLFKKAELLKLIKTYHIRYNEEVADTVARLLRIRTEILYKQFLRSPDSEGDYRKAEKQSEEFYQHIRNQKKEKQFSLSASEKKELQTKFRKASKLCHPDLIAHESKTPATKVFIALINAYNQNNLAKVSEILEKLESKNSYFSKISEEASEISRLELLEASIKSDITLIKQEIDDIESSQAFRVIKELKDWDAHFVFLKEKFEAEISRLEEEISNE